MENRETLTLEELGAKRPLLGNSAITSHLKSLGYPEISLLSFLKCGARTGTRILSNCRCCTKVLELTHHCNLRVCPTCSKVRKRRLGRKYYPYLSSLPINRRKFLYFLTISPRNYDTLEEGFTHLKKAFSNFLRVAYSKNKDGSIKELVSDRIQGGLYVIETKGGSGNWNIHLHAIVYGRWIDNKPRRGEDSKIVRIFKATSGRDVNIHVTKQDSARFTLNYMLKYISGNKDDFFTSKDMADYMVYTYRKRLIHTFGSFYGKKFKSLPFLCRECKTEVTFIYDLEVLRLYEDRLLIGEPPPDLFMYTS